MNMHTRTFCVADVNIKAGDVVSLGSDGKVYQATPTDGRQKIGIALSKSSANIVEVVIGGPMHTLVDFSRHTSLMSTKKRRYCEFCHSRSFEDKRGHCGNCGHPYRIEEFDAEDRF